jgi:hypothetical protein
MLDSLLRQTKERLLAPLAQTPLRYCHPTAITVVGSLVGLGAAGAAAFHLYGLGLGLWGLNRVLDGVDGTLARLQNKQSDLGGYLDIVLDIVVYAGIPIGLAYGQARLDLYLALAVLLASFYINTAAWMYLSGLLEKYQARQGGDAPCVCDQDPDPQLLPKGSSAKGSTQSFTSLVMPSGLIEGSETIVFYTLFWLLPAYLIPLFYAMAVLVGVSILQRVLWAVKHLPLLASQVLAAQGLDSQSRS